MSLTIALIVIIPISVRVHRYLTRERAARLLRDQLGEPSDQQQRPRGQG